MDAAPKYLDGMRKVTRGDNIDNGVLPADGLDFSECNSPTLLGGTHDAIEQLQLLAIGPRQPNNHEKVGIQVAVVEGGNCSG